MGDAIGSRDSVPGTHTHTHALFSAGIIKSGREKITIRIRPTRVYSDLIFSQNVFYVRNARVCIESVRVHAGFG